MQTSPPPEQRSFWQQIRSMLALSARQKLNQLGRWRGSPPKMRAATAHKDDYKFALPALFGLLFVALSFNFSYQAVHGLAKVADTKAPAETSEDAVIQVSFFIHFKLQGLFRVLDEEKNGPNRQRYETELTDWLASSLSLDQPDAEQEAQRLITHLENHGIEGFAYENSDNPYTFFDLRQLSPEAATWLGRVLAIIVGCLFIAITLMPLSTRTKDLGALDSQLEWFFCLPLSGREILSGRFAAMTIVRPLTWIVAWPFFSVLFWAMGFGGLGLAMSFVVTLAVAIISTGIELAIETWLRIGASFNAKKNVQSLATVFGMLAFYVSIAGGIAASRSATWLSWILDHSPPALTTLPGQLLMLPTGDRDGFLQVAALFGGFAVLCGVGGWVLAARALGQGLSSGNERQGDRTSPTSASGNSSLARFEWLLLRRDRNLATLVLIVPLMLVFYQFLINPEMLSVTSARNLAVIGFGCGAWAAIVTAPHVLMSENKSLWMIFSLPVEVAGYFERRVRIWRTTGVTMAAAVVAGLAIWKGGVPIDGWWRIPAALAGVWVVSLSIYAIMIGDARLPDPSQSDRPKVSVTRMYGCMLLSGIVGALLWQGTPWQVVTSLTLWWFFGSGLWQGLAPRLRHLMDPTRRAPGRLTITSALFAVIVFFLVQAAVAAVAVAVMSDQLATGILSSYVIAGLVALLFCASRLANHELPRTAPSPPSLILSIPLSTAACIACAWLWLQLIEITPPLNDIREAAAANAVLQLDPGDWRMILLFVVAAPLIEETLFRGFVFRIMQSVWSTRGAIFASALLFAIVHPALSFPPVFLLGLATSWLYFRSQKLWPGMLLHALYNAAIVAMQ